MRRPNPRSMTPDDTVRPVRRQAFPPSGTDPDGMDRGGATGVARSGCAGSGGRARLDPAGVQQVGQFAGLEHLAAGDAADHALALYVQPRGVRTGRKIIEYVADRRVLERADALRS